MSNNNNFWKTVEECEPPIGVNVWTTVNPFLAAPKVRCDSWNGGSWNHNGYRRVYWMLPINNK